MWHCPTYIVHGFNYLHKYIVTSRKSTPNTKVLIVGGCVKKFKVLKLTYWRICFGFIFLRFIIFLKRFPRGKHSIKLRTFVDQIRPVVHVHLFTRQGHYFILLGFIWNFHYLPHKFGKTWRFILFQSRNIYVKYWIKTICKNIRFSKKENKIH